MTTKQKQNIARFKRVVAEAKKLRKKNPGLTQPQAVKQAWAILYKSGKKVGATKIIEKGEKKSAKVTKVLQRIRTKKGTFKGTKRVAGSSHKDTKSHNVNIRVVSGVESGKKKMLLMWKDVYGKLASEYVSSKNVKEKKHISKQMKDAREIIQKLK